MSVEWYQSVWMRQIAIKWKEEREKKNTHTHTEKYKRKIEYQTVWSTIDICTHREWNEKPITKATQDLWNYTTDFHVTSAQINEEINGLEINQNGMGTRAQTYTQITCRARESIAFFQYDNSWQSHDIHLKHVHEIRWWRCEGNNATHSIYPLYNHLHISHFIAIDILLCKTFGILDYWCMYILFFFFFSILFFTWQWSWRHIELTP